MKTKILVTGASGFVGRSFCLRHAGRDDLEIRGLARRPSDLSGYFQADLSRPLEIDWTPDVVIHAAARSSPWGSLDEFRRHNVEATRNVVTFCERRGVGKLVYVSSSSVFYHEGDQLGITEETPIGPDFVSHYARTKAEGEAVAKGFSRACCVLRPRAVFGPGDTVLFPRILRAAASGRMVRFSRPGPPALGDLIYIDALSDYLLKASLAPSAVGDYNLTNNESIVLQDFLEEVFERLDLPPVTRTLSVEKAMRIAGALEWFYRIFVPGGEPPITRYGIGVLAYSKTFDVTKSLRVLGHPSVSLAQGVDRFVEWQAAQMGK